MGTADSEDRMGQGEWACRMYFTGAPPLASAPVWTLVSVDAKRRVRARSRTATSGAVASLKPKHDMGALEASVSLQQSLRPPTRVRTKDVVR